jgi:hypothetical protein
LGTSNSTENVEEAVLLTKNCHCFEYGIPLIKNEGDCKKIGKNFFSHKLLANGAVKR